MTLGIDRDAAKHRRWQNGFLAGAIVFGLAALGDAMGTAYALTAPGYVFEDGELDGEVLVFALATALMAGCVAAGRWHDRRRAALAAEHERWLPGPAERDDQGQVDFDVETTRSRTLALRSVGLVLVWLVVLAGVVAGFAAMEASSDHLLKTGARVTGEVLGVYKRDRGDDKIYVAYPVGSSGIRYADIVWDSDRQYTKGQLLTVVYDKADPSRVRTVDETNTDETWMWALVIGLVAGLSGVVFSVIAAANWRRRHRAVRATGWRIASVTVVPDYPVRQGRHMPDIEVAYRDGSRITLRAATSSHGSVPLKDQPDRRAWIGGTDRDMVVLFPHGRWRQPPYAVPAYALNTRSGAKPATAPAPENPEQAEFVKHGFRRLMIVLTCWYALMIAGFVVVLVLNLWWPLFLLGVVGSLWPIPLIKAYLSRMRAALEEK